MASADKAITVARRVARGLGETVFIWVECGDYSVGTSEDRWTYFAGQEPIFEVTPEGWVR